MCRAIKQHAAAHLNAHYLTINKSITTATEAAYLHAVSLNNLHSTAATCMPVAVGVLTALCLAWRVTDVPHSVDGPVNMYPDCVLQTLVAEEAAAAAMLSAAEA
jgi:hypothetical protein